MQYGKYLWRLLHGDLGYSYATQLPVTHSILQRFPATVMVAVFGIFFELLIGIPIGMVSALRQYSVRDRAFTVFSLLGHRRAVVLAGADPHVRVRLPDTASSPWAATPAGR